MHHTGSPLSTGDGDDIAGRGVGDLGDESSVAHLLVLFADVLDPGVGFFEVFGFNGNGERVRRLEGEGLGVE